MGSQKPNSQASRALSLLREHRGQWVAAYLVAQVAGLQYGARIHSLRHRGYVISNRVEWHDGQQLGWFKLESEPTSAPIKSRGVEPQSALFDLTKGHKDNG